LRSEPIAEVIAGDPEKTCGAGDVAVGLGEGETDETEDGVFEGETAIGELEVGAEPIGIVLGRGGGIGGRGAEEAVEFEFRAVFEDEGTFDFVGEFADIARPAVVEEATSTEVGDGTDGEALAATEVLEEVGCEEEDFGAAKAEWRDLDAEQVEAVVEVFAEGAKADGIPEVGVGGGDDPGIDGDELVAADASDAVAFDGGEEFGLKGGAEGVDFVEEEGAIGGGFEEADAGGAGVGEGTAFVAEQFGFGEGIGDGGAIGLDEGAVGTGAALMDPAGEGRFAGTGLAEEEDGRQVGFHATIGGEDALELGFERCEMGAEEEGEIRGLPAAMFLCAGGLPGAAGAGEGEGEGFGFERFLEVIEGAELDGIDSIANAAIGGHDDDTGVVAEGFVTEEIGAEAIGEIHVEEGEVEAAFGGEATGGEEGIG
jgi:hypothetical protein